MQIIPAIDGLNDASQTRIVLYQSGRFVHAPALGIGLQPLDATLTALINGTIDPSKAYRRGNILGTVSQSSGTPTGAIIERGSNANGEYVRFADGTQICWATKAGEGPDTAAGALYAGNLQTWTFPAVFSAPPLKFAGSTNSLRLASHVGGGTTSSSYREISPNSSATALDVQLLAIGRWF